MLARKLDELDEDAARRAWMHEGHATVDADPWRAVDELDTLMLQAVKRAREIRDLEAQVVHRGAPALGQKTSDAGFAVGRFQQLDTRLAARDEDDLDALVADVVHRADGIAEDVAIERKRVSDPRHDDADVMERPSVSEAAHRARGS